MVEMFFSEPLMSDTLSADQKETPEGLLDPKPKKKKLLIILLGGVVIIGGGAGYAWKKNLLPISALKHDVTKDETGVKSLVNPPVVLGIPPATANLDNGNGKTVYVKMTATVEISGAKPGDNLSDRIPEIQDIFQTYLHETRPQDLHGNGFYRLREALLRRLRSDLAPLNVSNIYITEFLTQ